MQIRSPQTTQRDVAIGTQKSPEMQMQESICDSDRSRAQNSGLSPSMPTRVNEIQSMQQNCSSDECVAQAQRDKWNKIMGTVPAVQSPSVLGLREQQERLEASQRATENAWNSGQQVNYPSTASQYQKMTQSPQPDKSTEYAA